jgi:hydroxymethylbilane synthase
MLKIGTRGSSLALAQSRWIKTNIENRWPDLRIELVTIKTTGDKILNAPLSKIGGKGLFVKEIEESLLRKEIHLAVHSMKDIPAELPDSLMICGFPERENPHDAFVSNRYDDLGALPPGARVGTGSLRRGAQILHLRPDIRITPIRGNVQTRLRKMDSGALDAVILAAAGLIRLGLQERIRQEISTDLILPAVGQGALGLEIRKDDEETISLLHSLNHVPTQIAVTAERAFLAKLEGGCQVPIAAYAHLKGEQIVLQGMVAELDGRKIIRNEMVGQKQKALEIGESLGDQLLRCGADRILASIYHQG